MRLNRLIVVRAAASLLFAVAVLLVPAIGTAQDTSVVLTARVLDNNGAPVADAEVFIVKLDRVVRTGADGIFRVTGVSAGRYEVGVRKVGYLPRAATVATGNGSLVPTIQLVGFTTRMMPVVTYAKRNGLSGVVSDTALRAIPRARVKVAGSGRTVTTDSAGRFFMDLSAGSYLVAVDRDSFARQTLSVTVPKDSGREIAVWLSPRKKANRALEIMEEVRIFDLDQKMIRAARQSSRFYTREQLETQKINNMFRLATTFMQGSITAECTISIMNDGGQPYRVPLNSVDTDDVEFVELYMPSANNNSGRRGRSLSGLRTTIVAETSSGIGISPHCGNLSIGVWLRK